MKTSKERLLTQTLLRIFLIAVCTLLFGGGLLVLLESGSGLVLEVSEAEAARPGGEYGKDWGDPKGQECVLCHRKHKHRLYD